MNNNKFEDLQVPDIPRQTIHLEWDDLRDMAIDLLRRLLNRKVIYLDTERCDHYDWGFTFVNGDWMNSIELDKLFAAIDADDWDKETTGINEGPIHELSQSVSRKLISLLLPFRADASLADEQGVWFISELSGPKAGVKPAFPNEMPDDETLLIELIQDGIEYELKDYEDAVYRKGAKELWTNLFSANIYKEVASMVTDYLGGHFNLKNDTAELQIIYDLAKRGTFLKTIHGWALGSDNLDISTCDAIAQLIQEYCDSQLEQDE